MKNTLIFELMPLLLIVVDIEKMNSLEREIKTGILREVLTKP